MGQCGGLHKFMDDFINLMEYKGYNKNDLAQMREVYFRYLKQTNRKLVWLILLMVLHKLFQLIFKGVGILCAIAMYWTSGSEQADKKISNFVILGFSIVIQVFAGFFMILYHLFKIDTHISTLLERWMDLQEEGCKFIQEVKLRYQDDENKIRVKRHPEDKHRAFHERRPLDKLVFHPPDNLDQITENQDHGIGEQ